MQNLVLILILNVSSLAFGQWFPAPAQTVDFTVAERQTLKDEFQKVYSEDIQKLGGTLDITFFPSIFSYMAMATVQPGNVYRVAIMAGNLSRKSMTMDSLRLLICHEVGHFLGGGPRRIDLDPEEEQTWNVVEGASDYFATTQCMKRILKGQDHSKNRLDPVMDEDSVLACTESFTTEDERAICERSLAASRTLITFFAKVKGVENTFRFDTPDTSVVPSSLPAHPELQCRLDTFRAGSLCNVEPESVMDPKDLSQGTCSNRPACWFQD